MGIYIIKFRGKFYISMYFSCSAANLVLAKLSEHNPGHRVTRCLRAFQEMLVTNCSASDPSSHLLED